MKHLHSFFIFVGTLAIAYGQKVVPGVNPAHYMDQNQHYQQPPPQVQYVQPGQPIHQMPPQGQPMHQMPPQGQPIQHVQPPVQPMHHDPNVMHQQQQQQQQQQQHQQMAGSPPIQRHPQQVLDTANIQGEKAHIQEHIDVPMDTSKMSEQELQFHYFKMHDSDHNNKLDGCELIKSLIHWHEKTNKDSTAHHQEEPGHHEKIFSDEELVALIDPILAMDDTGRDGYIDYPEFIKAQQKAAAQNKAEKP